MDPCRPDPGPQSLVGVRLRPPTLPETGNHRPPGNAGFHRRQGERDLPWPTGHGQDDAGHAPHRRGEILRGGEQGCRFLHVTPGGGDADLESSGQQGVGVAATRMGEAEQCLAARVDAPPPGSALVTVAADAVSEVVERSARQRDRRRVGQHRRGPWSGHRILSI
jgi:hypothetical protein